MTQNEQNENKLKAKGHKRNRINIIWKQKGTKWNKMKMNWKGNRNEAKQDENKNEMNYQFMECMDSKLTLSNCK